MLQCSSLAHAESRYCCWTALHALFPHFCRSRGPTCVMLICWASTAWVFEKHLGLACLDFALLFIYQDLSSFASAVSWLFRVNTSATILVVDSHVGFLNLVSHSLIWRVFWLLVYKTRLQKQICSLFLHFCISSLTFRARQVKIFLLLKSAN